MWQLLPVTHLPDGGPDAFLCQRSQKKCFISNQDFVKEKKQNKTLQY